MEKLWLTAKSNIAIGLFVGFFGINQFFVNQSTVAFIIGSIFVALGGYNIWGGYKAYRYYLPIAAKEATELNKQQ